MSVAENLRTGLLLTGMGMGLVFLTLILVMLCAMILNRMFKPKVQGDKPGQHPSSTFGRTRPEIVDAPAAPAENARREAVAIGVAIALERKARREQQDLPFETIIVATIDPGPGTWKSQGRILALQ